MATQLHKENYPETEMYKISSMLLKGWFAPDVEDVSEEIFSLHFEDST